VSPIDREREGRRKRTGRSHVSFSGPGAPGSRAFACPVDEYATPVRAGALRSLTTAVCCSLPGPLVPAGSKVRTPCRFSHGSRALITDSRHEFTKHKTPMRSSLSTARLNLAVHLLRTLTCIIRALWRLLIGAESAGSCHPGPGLRRLPPPRRYAPNR
jgi:hypothetical protein